MTLQEMLDAVANKMFRELAFEKHPDRGGSNKKMQELLAVKEAGSAAIKKYYANEKKGKGPKPKPSPKPSPSPKPKPKPKPKPSYDDTEKNRKKEGDTYYNTYVEYAKEIQKEINDNAIKMNVEDRIKLFVRKDVNGKLDLIITYSSNWDGVQNFFIMDIINFTKHALKNMVLNKIINSSFKKNTFS